MKHAVKHAVKDARWSTRDRDEGREMKDAR
jgi:hypothetical protein